jgi:glucosamine--fructose-6-phosphate aminotransferase (isomerizing)
MGVINVVGSLIASNVDCGVYLNIGREVAVPATKSFTAQVTALIMMAIWISHQKKKAHLYSKRKELKNLLR